MKPQDSDRIRFDMFRYFKPEHPHIYNILVLKGKFSFLEHRSAPSYAAIAARFQDVIDWLREARKTEEGAICSECGIERIPPSQVLQYTVHTDWWEEEILNFEDDDCGWNKMTLRLEEAICELRSLPEPSRPCKKCGRKRHAKRSRPSGTMSGHAASDLDELDRDSD